MENPTSSEVLAAAQVLRRFNQYLNDQAVRQAKALPPPDAAIREGAAIETPALAKMQTVDEIIVKLIVWAEQLRQRQNTRRSHVKRI